MFDLLCFRRGTPIFVVNCTQRNTERKKAQCSRHCEWSILDLQVHVGCVFSPRTAQNADFCDILLHVVILGIGGHLPRQQSLRFVQLHLHATDVDDIQGLHVGAANDDRCSCC